MGDPSVKPGGRGRGKPALQANKTWFKPKTASKPEAEELKEEESEYQDEGEEDEGEEYEGESDPNEDEVSSQPPPALNKGKNLRSLIQNFRKSKVPTPSSQDQSSSNESSEKGYNSDTFGNVKQPKFTGKRSKEGPKFLSQTIKAAEEEKDDGLSNIDSMGDEENEAPIETTPVKFDFPCNLIKISNEKALERIQKLSKEAEQMRARGDLSPIETEKAQLIRMCEISEALKRQSSRELSIFEMDPEKTDLSVFERDNPPQVKLEWAVKIFKRPAADVKVDDPITVRPLQMMTLTVDYLLDEI